MAESVIGKLWDILKPPPQAGPPSEKVLAQRRRQRRLIRITLIAILVCGGAGGVYSYIASAPQRADKEYSAGMLDMGPGRYDEAIVHFNKAIGIWPRHPLAYLERGVAHRYLQQPDQALADLDMAAALDLALSQAHAERGIIFRERGDTKAALEEFTKSVGAKPTIEGYYELAQTYENLGQHQKAIEFYDEAIREMPDAPYVYRARALARANAGDLQGAQQDRQTAAAFERSR